MDVQSNSCRVCLCCCSLRQCVAIACRHAVTCNCCPQFQTCTLISSPYVCCRSILEVHMLIDHSRLEVSCCTCKHAIEVNHQLHHDSHLWHGDSWEAGRAITHAIREVHMHRAYAADGSLVASGRSKRCLPIAAVQTCDPPLLCTLIPVSRVGLRL